MQESKHKELNDELLRLVSKVNMDYGENNVWAVLDGKCVSASIDKYTYEVLPQPVCLAPSPFPTCGNGVDLLAALAPGCRSALGERPSRKRATAARPSASGRVTGPAGTSSMTVARPAGRVRSAVLTCRCSAAPRRSSTTSRSRRDANTLPCCALRQPVARMTSWQPTPTFRSSARWSSR